MILKHTTYINNSDPGSSDTMVLVSRVTSEDYLIKSVMCRTLWVEATQGKSPSCEI